ncbi:MAG: MlaD family protein [Verrucomicrobiota bacterium]|jgi:phospholipid/cholesterol/gamma-HCH transport system substrate-binding protein
MEKSHLETKVGLFVLVGLALLAVLLIQFSKGTSLFRGTYELRLHANNVGGLKPRSAVLLAGVQVGSVSEIKLANDGKRVTILLNIYKENKIYHDARFVIEMSGFLGDQYVSVIPTANQLPLLQDGADVPCEQPFNLQEVARSASGFILRIDETAKKLDTAISDVNAFIATNGSQFDLAVSNAVFFSQELARLASSARNVITTNSEGISASVKNIESSTEVLKKLMDDLQSGKGLAGAMLKNEQLATNAQEIADNLTIATSNLNRLGLWRFLWHHEPPHTNEMTQKP